jgi:endonuclease III
LRAARLRGKVAAMRVDEGAKARRSAKPVAKKRRPARPDPARVTALLQGLDALYPAATCELQHAGPYQLVVATILSAQCTDARVNQVTPALFQRWPDPAALAAARQPQIEAVIRTTGFFRNKARSLKGMARKLVESFGGQVPRTMEEMLELPGVARKTANVVLGTAYGIASGVVVDTHVQRLAQRLGLTREQDPVKIEQDLMRILPRERWVAFAHQIIWHGRRVCAARNPRCAQCPLPCPSRREIGPGPLAADVPRKPLVA